MSRTPTVDELRAVYAELKRQGLSRYDYDELVRIDKQGRLLMSCDVADAQRPASQAIKTAFKRLAAFQIVALNKLTTGDNWPSTGSKNSKGPFTWAIYLEIDDDTSHPDIFLDGYDAVLEYIPELDGILDVARQNGVDIAKKNVHADIRGKNKIKECDGGGAAAGGDAGGAAGGDGGAAAAATSGDAAVGTSVGDVLGNCDHSHGEGYFGPACFHVPSKAVVPFHRWEIGNGGSKRKKDKRGRDKKYAYEKGMKVVVDMFEEGEEDN